MVAGRSLGEAVRSHGEALVGFWGTPLAETSFTPLDETIAQLKHEDPFKFETNDLVLESDLDGEPELSLF